MDQRWQRGMMRWTKPRRSLVEASKCLLPLMSHVNKLKCSSNDVWQHMQRLLMWEVHPSLGVLESHWSHSHRHVAPLMTDLSYSEPSPFPDKIQTIHYKPHGLSKLVPCGKGLFGTDY